MDITLIQPFTANTEPPLTLGFLAGALDEAGHKVRIIDMQIPAVRKNWLNIFTSMPADLVGITAMTPQIRQAHDIAQEIKSIRRDIKIVSGGVHATLLPEQTLQEFPGFDILVIGEGERTIVELASKLERNESITDVRGTAYRANGKSIVTEPRPRILDLDQCANPHKYYDFEFYLNNYSSGVTDRCVSMIVSRGCPYSCRFCATKSFWSQKYISKSTDGIIEEINYVLNRGAEGIVFRDSTFNINKRWVDELCKKIIGQRLRFKWAVNARVNLVDYELFKRMRKAGLDTVYFGVESGSQRILDFYGKGVTLKQTEKAFEVCRKLRIRTGAYFMLGALPETREDIDLTHQFVKKLKPTSSLVFLFMPLPGSELYKEYIKEGYHFDYSDIRSEKASFAPPGFSVEELESIRKQWYLEFNKTPNLLTRGVNCVMEIRSWRDVKKVAGKLKTRIAS
jgi:anaerobic magnesium-protoporphyrin IX monomethyl ester cyclase